MYFPGMKLGFKIFSFIDIFMPTYQRSPKTETAGPPGERIQPFAIPAHPQSRQPCPMENQYHETEKNSIPGKKTVSFATRTIFQITL